jgi:hypothetical protein
MKKTRYVIFSSLIILFCFCQKKGNNATIRLTGMTLDWFDHTPVLSSIEVLAQDPLSHKEEVIHIITFDNESDGSFNKEIQAARSREYYIRVTGQSISYHEDGITISDGSTRDLGEIYKSHSFVCKIHLVRDPGSIQSVQLASGFIVPFDRSADTVCYERKDISYSKNASYTLYYKVFSGSSVSRTLTLPILKSDTLLAEITY